MAQLGRVVVHHCLKTLNYKTRLQNGSEVNYFESTDNLDLVEHVTGLFYRPDILANEDAYGDISTSLTALLCCSLLHCSPSTTSRFIKRFIRAHRSNYTPEFALTLGAFAFSRYNYPTINLFRQLYQNQDLGPIARAERALDIFWHYLSRMENYLTELAVLGLRYLQAESSTYDLAVDDMQEVSRALTHYNQPASRSRKAVIYTLPASFNVYTAHN